MEAVGAINIINQEENNNGFKPTIKKILNISVCCLECFSLLRWSYDLYYNPPAILAFAISTTFFFFPNKKAVEEVEIIQRFNALLFLGNISLFAAQFIDYKKESWD